MLNAGQYGERGICPFLHHIIPRISHHSGRNSSRDIFKKLRKKMRNNYHVTKKLPAFLYKISDKRSRVHRSCRTAHVLCYDTVFYALLNGSDNCTSGLVLPDVVE
jgi:hypothetical protein